MTPPGRREVAGLVAAVLVGVGWLFLKPAHAINHLTFIGCHLFLFQAMGWLLIVRDTTLESRRMPASMRPTRPSPSGAAGIDRTDIPDHPRSAGSPRRM